MIVRDFLICLLQMYLLEDLEKNMLPYRRENFLGKFLVYFVIALVMLGINHLESSIFNMVMIPVTYMIVSMVVFRGNIWKKLVIVCCYYVLAIIPEFLFATLTNAYGVTGASEGFGTEIEKTLALLLMSTMTFLFIKCINQVTRKRDYLTIENKTFTVLLMLPTATIIILGCVFYSNISFEGMNRVMVPVGASLLLLTNIFIFSVFDRFVEKSEEVKKMARLYQKSRAEIANLQYMNKVNEDNRAFLHDINKFICTVAGLMEEGENQEVKEIMEHLGVRIQSLQKGVYCEHPILNSILCERKFLAESKNISYKITLGNDLRLDFLEELDMISIEEILHMWNIGAEDSVLNISAFDFDLSVFDIFGLLTVGGTIVLIDEDDFRDPEVWKNLIEIYGITIWNSAPALLDMFLIMGENNHFGKLRLALVSGDWIPLYLPEKWYKVTSANSQFVALGGATEGGIWSNYYCVSKVDRLWNSIPYGQALPKQKYRITDENFVECGVDIPGELQIGGGSLAKGYINDEELTMKKFITDVKGERWYRTGDRGRRWADGTIEFLGRMDTQVKIRGHRIELGEIESVLKSISRIKEAVVVAQGDKYHKELVAFYLGEYIAESEIEDYLKIHLPEYSIPNSINRLENFPLNANGKVDRRRLAEYQKTDSVEIMSDKVLNIVLMIWEELLKNKVADLDENLFKIGADSLLAARFVAAINARCGIEVRMKEVFMNPSINALTKLVDKRKNTDIAEFVEEGEI